MAAPRALALVCAVSLSAQSPAPSRVSWTDVEPLHRRLAALGITAQSFAGDLARIHAENLRRVREGDLDHLVFYLLQSTRFSSLPPLEPALSAKTLVDGLDARDRERFFRDPASALARIDASVRSRIDAFLESADSAPQESRLLYFRSLAASAFPERSARAAALAREYLRVMKFLYEKEFVAQADGAQAVATLYRTRGFSTDTAVEAGFLVHQGLGIAHGIDPDRRVRRALIIGPGLDLAPRTALTEAAPPHSYQPWAVIDALLEIGLAQPADLEVVAADINPRVVSHIRAVSSHPPELTLTTEVGERDGVRLTDDYREYFVQLGRRIGDVTAAAAAADARLRKSIRVDPRAARTLHAATLDIVTERLRGAPFDLVVATNILPYFDDVRLMLAMSNIAAMLAPGGILVHNERRPMLHELTIDLGMPVEQSRHAIIASGPGPVDALVDSVWVHRKKTAAHLLR